MGPKERARTVICVHGLTRNARDFDASRKRSSRTGASSCPDIVGRGRSDWLADKQQYTFATYCGDMVALMARLGQDTYDWVGTSMGGFVGMFLAAQPNSPIRRLVFNDAGAFVPKSAPQRMLEYVGIEKVVPLAGGGGTVLPQGLQAVRAADRRAVGRSHAAQRPPPARGSHLHAHFTIPTSSRRCARRKT